MTTIREQLRIMRDPGLEQWEHWIALVIILEQMNNALGVDLDLQFEETTDDNQTTFD